LKPTGTDSLLRSQILPSWSILPQKARVSGRLGHPRDAMATVRVALSVLGKLYSFGCHCPASAPGTFRGGSPNAGRWTMHRCSCGVWSRCLRVREQLLYRAAAASRTCRLLPLAAFGSRCRNRLRRRGCFPLGGSPLERPRDRLPDARGFSAIAPSWGSRWVARPAVVTAIVGLSGFALLLIGWQLMSPYLLPGPYPMCGVNWAGAE
jgi:hypothetical protein